MVPNGLMGYFTACSAVAGTLIGLLFVSITLRYDAIFGSAAQAQNRATASSGFIALANALAISLWALIDLNNLGWAAIGLSVACAVSTWKLHMGPKGRRDTSKYLFAMSMLLYGYELVIGAMFLATPSSKGDADTLAYITLSAIGAGMIRAWRLLLPERTTPASQGGSGSPPAASGPAASES